MNDAIRHLIITIFSWSAVLLVFLGVVTYTLITERLWMLFTLLVLLALWLAIIGVLLIENKLHLLGDYFLNIFLFRICQKNRYLQLSFGVLSLLLALSLLSIVLISLS